MNALGNILVVEDNPDWRDKLEANANYWRKGLTEAGFILKEGDTPIVPVMLFNAKLSQDISRDLYEEGIYAIGFFFPVVAKGQARIPAGARFSRNHCERKTTKWLIA